MTAPEAHALLDAAKLGLDVSEQQILRALVATGDLAVPERRYLPPAGAPWSEDRS